MLTSSSFLFEKNGFKVYKLSVFGYIYFVAEKPDSKSMKRHIRKSLPILERMIAVE